MQRLEMRAKKFGLPLSVDAKKAVRAERFNNSSLSNTLNKRVERFKVSETNDVSKEENDEKLLKRKERFGLASDSSGVQSEKAKQRLERFKQPVK